MLSIEVGETALQRSAQRNARRTEAFFVCSFLITVQSDDDFGDEDDDEKYMIMLVHLTMSTSLFVMEMEMESYGGLES